jgi:hypothetical protein
MHNLDERDVFLVGDFAPIGCWLRGGHADC